MATTDDSTQKNNKVLYGIIGVLGALVLILGFMLIQEKGTIMNFSPRTRRLV